MEKKIKIIISVFLIIFILAVICFCVKLYAKQIEREFAKVVYTYMEASKNANNQLMNTADLFQKAIGGLTYEEASGYLVSDIDKCKELVSDADIAYKDVEDIKTKNKNILALKEAAKKDYEQLIIFSQNILEKTKDNFNGDYSKTYKEWEEPFADAHKKLVMLLAKY